MSLPVRLAEKLDAGQDQYRVYESAPNGEWLAAVAKEYVRLRTSCAVPLTAINLDGIEVLDLRATRARMRSATIPPRVGGNFDVVRADFSEVASYLLLQDQYGTKFLVGEAQEISSQLARLIDRADEIEGNFSLATVERWPELSNLLQFLAHAMKVSGSEQLAEDVEDLLRASLVYHQARRVSEERAQRLVDLCRSYLRQIQGRSEILPLADQTGFATPSVLALLARRSSLPELTESQNWMPAHIFGEDLSTLALCIQSISGLPEMQLSEGRGRPFDPRRVAAIIRDWVQGATLEELTSSYSLESESVPADRRIAHFARYLFSTLLGQASWGLGALETVYLDAVGGDHSHSEEAYVPSMVFFGVRQPEAVWMRMVGVPRVVANGVATLWRQTQPAAPESFQELRGWVNQLSDTAWGQAIPAGSQLTANDMRLLWRDFVGQGAGVSA
jgi:hypothetical protein